MNPEPIFGQPVHVPIRRALQRFRWFTASFEHEAAIWMKATGVGVEITDQALGRVFLDWRAAFMAQRPEHPEQRERFVGFAAGLMLRAMIRNAPVCRVTPRDGAAATDPVGYWPEGHLYVSYCLAMRAAILHEEFGHDVPRSPVLDDLRSWQSFRENVTEDSALAIPFLDLLAGETPDWTARDMFSWNADANVVGMADHRN